MNLYLRLFKVLLRLPFVPRRDLLDAGRLTFRVWPNDCDLNLHLNNGRYLTFMDLGRLHLIAQIGFLRALFQRRWAPVLSAAEMNFIRPLGPLRKFELVTRLLSWDEKYFYIEQRFEVGGRLHAIGMIKGLFLHGRERVESREVMAMLGFNMPAPDMPEALRHWIALSELKKQQPVGAVTAEDACPFCRTQNEKVLWRDDTRRIVLIEDPGYPGYCRVVWNAHVREMTELSPQQQTLLMNTVFTVEQVLRAQLRPDKINLASLGNQVPHLHWHVIPRFRDDAHFPDPIWAAVRRTGGTHRIDIQALQAALAAELKGDFPS